jgi:hypothetical protein
MKPGLTECLLAGRQEMIVSPLAEFAPAVLFRFAQQNETAGVNSTKRFTFIIIP